MVITVKTTEGRNAVLTCGHKFRIGKLCDMPVAGAAACCPICERKPRTSPVPYRLTRSTRAAIGALLRAATMGDGSESTDVQVFATMLVRMAVELGRGHNYTRPMSARDVEQFLKWWEQTPGPDNEEFFRDRRSEPRRPS